MSGGRSVAAAAGISGLYGILDPSVVIRGNDEPEGRLDGALAEALGGGCRLVQYRDKGTHPRLLLSRAMRLAKACREAGALFIVNDRLDIALLSGAGGCHLGQDDLPLPAARRIVPEDFILGASTHDAAEARKAEAEGADYVGVGPVYRSTSKGNARAPRGPRLVAEVASAVRIPAVAISGISRGNVREVTRAGASAFAVISDLFTGPGIRQRTEEFLRIWKDEKARR